MATVAQSGAWNIRTSRTTTPDLDILFHPIGADVTISVVLDSSTVAADPGDGVRRLRAGTALSKNVNNQYERFTGAAGQAVRGILAFTVEFPDNLSHSDAPAAMWAHTQWFRADRIIDWATPAIRDAIVAALPTCKFS